MPQAGPAVASDPLAAGWCRPGESLDDHDPVWRMAARELAAGKPIGLVAHLLRMPRKALEERLLRDDDLMQLIQYFRELEGLSEEERALQLRLSLLRGVETIVESGGVRGLGWAFRLLLGQAGRVTAAAGAATGREAAASPADDMDGMLRCLLEMGPVDRFEYLKHGFHTHRPQELRGFVNLISAITRFYNRNLSSDDGIDLDNYPGRHPDPMGADPPEQGEDEAMLADLLQSKMAEMAGNAPAAAAAASPAPPARPPRQEAAREPPAPSIVPPAAPVPEPLDPPGPEAFRSAAASVGPAGSVPPPPRATTAGWGEPIPAERPRGRGS